MTITIVPFLHDSHLGLLCFDYAYLLPYTMNHLAFCPEFEQSCLSWPAVRSAKAQVRICIGLSRS